jgi:predicted porin
MKKPIVAFAVLGGSMAFACAQSREPPEGGAAANNPPPVFTVEQAGQGSNARADQDGRAPGQQAWPGVSGNFSVLTLGRQHDFEYRALTEVDEPLPGGLTGSSATSLVGTGANNRIRHYGTSVRGLSAGTSWGAGDFDGSAANRAWGLTVGVEAGPLTVRAAHQNRNVAKVHLYDMAGNNMDAKNSIISATMRFGWGSAYAAFSASRGWGRSPLFNPDNPYGAGMASTPSTDSRDVLMGVAVPLGHATTLLASFIRRNDRDLSNRDARQLAIGATYAVSRRTDFYAAYSHIQNLGSAALSVGTASVRGSRDAALNIGMRHAF